MAANLREKYALFSIGAQDRSWGGVAGSPSMELERAVALYSQPVLQVLGTDRDLTVQDLVRQLGDRIGEHELPDYGEFLGLLTRLEQLNLIKTVKKDPFGNNIIRGISRIGNVSLR